MHRIKQATGVSEINDVITKFATQSETYENLKDIKSQNEKKLLILTEKRQNVKDDLEKMKLDGLEALTRKQVEDKERQLAAAEQKHERQKEIHDKSKKKLLDLQAGIEHLSGKLQEIKLEGFDHEDIENIHNITLSNLVEGLNQARQKLKILYKYVQSDSNLFEEAMAHVKSGGLSGNQASLMKNPSGNFFQSNKQEDGRNIRIKLEDEHDDMSDGEYEVDRAQGEQERLRIKERARLSMKK